MYTAAPRGNAGAIFATFSSLKKGKLPSVLAHWRGGQQYRFAAKCLRIIATQIVNRDKELYCIYELAWIYIPADVCAIIYVLRNLRDFFPLSP